jgi:chromatin remodeling complex protein RSC6
MTELIIVQPDIDAQFNLIQESLTKFKTNLTDIQQQLRALEKTVKKEAKESKKREQVKPRQQKITGFNIPEKIKPELCTYMKLADNTSTRNAVTSFITEYIRANNLQDMSDRKVIHLNAELAALFKMELTDKLTYFNLHKHISGLFIR